MAPTKAKKKVTKNAKPTARRRAPVTPPKKAAPWPSRGTASASGAARSAAKKGKPPAKAGNAVKGAAKAGKSPPAKSAKELKAKALKPAKSAPVAKRKASPSRASAPKAAAPARAPGKNATSRSAVRRYDRPGHLDPHYAAELRRQSGSPDHDPRAFVEEHRAMDDLAEERGEEVIGKATTGEDEAEELLDQVVPEEQGGPFVETNAAQEFAHDTDASNPKDAKREPFPTT